MDSAVLAAEAMGTVWSMAAVSSVISADPAAIRPQAKTGISSLELSRHLVVKYDTAWLLHNKILRAMSEREDAYVLRGKIQMDDA